MKFLGFENDEDDYDDADDYSDEQPRNSRRTKNNRTRGDVSRQGSGNSSETGLILFKGIPTDQDKRRLRDAFSKGKMILIDLHGMTRPDFEEEGKPLIDFMSGVAFACGGEIKFIDPAQYIVTPRHGMYEVWPEEPEEGEQE